MHAEGEGFESLMLHQHTSQFEIISAGCLIAAEHRLARTENKVQFLGEVPMEHDFIIITSMNTVRRKGVAPYSDIEIAWQIREEEDRRILEILESIVDSVNKDI